MDDKKTVVLEEFWVLKDENTGLFLTKIAEGTKISYFQHFGWRSAVHFDSKEAARKLYAEMVKKSTKRELEIWIRLKPHKITTQIEG